MIGSPEFRLVPLDCPSCGAPLEAREDDVVYYCTACRNGYRYDFEEHALAPVEVAFVALPGAAADRYLPFWLLPAEVEIRARKGLSGGFSGIMGLFTGGSDLDSPRIGGTFAVPAFRAPLRSVTELTRRYTEKFPELDERLGEKLLGGCYGVRDAEKLAHFALIASEVEKPDTLKQLRYEIRFEAPRLLGVPFVRKGEGLADGLFGIVI